MDSKERRGPFLSLLYSITTLFTYLTYSFAIFFLLIGVDHLIFCYDQNAASYADAHRIASTISTSALVKTALYGEDAKYDISNIHIRVVVLIPVCLSWGRVLSSTGSTPLSTPLDPTLVSVAFVPSPTSPNPTPLVVLKNGEPVGVDEARASEILGEEDFEIKVNLGGQGVGGNEAACYWTCDFSYVRFFFPRGRGHGNAKRVCAVGIRPYQR